MKKTILSLLIIFVSIGAFSQIDTEFWFAAPELTVKHTSPDSIRFCFTSFDQPANIVISQPGITDPNDPDYLAPITISMPANSYKVLYLKPYKNRGIVEILPRKILPFGFFISSDTPISAYYAVTASNSEVYTLKGRNALGTDFLVPMQSNFSNAHDGTSSIQIVATENNTQVDIDTRVITTGNLQLGRISVTLNRGDAYAIGAFYADGARHLHNTRITSNKPIAVNSTDDSVAETGQDLVGDQLVPVDLAGDKYIAIKNSGNVERLYIFAIEQGTEVYVDNVLTRTINPGDVMTVDLKSRAKTTLITSADEKKIIVFQLTSSGGELGGTMLPKITCTGSPEIAFRPAFSNTSTNKPTVNILAKTKYVSEFWVNGIKGSQLTATDFTLVANAPEWSYCSKQLDLANGMIRLRNDSAAFHAAVLDVGGGTFTYGYFSDYNTTYLLPQSSKPYYFADEQVQLSLVNASVFENIVWTTPDGTQIQQDGLSFVASLDNAGLYAVKAVHKDGCPISVSYNVVVHVLDPESNSISLCKGDTMDITANGYAPYEWKSGGSKLSNEKTILVWPDNDICYTVSNYRTGANIFLYGDFSLGNKDITSDYSESATLAADGSFAIASDASKLNPAYSAIYDHTTGDAATGNHMIVKCAGTSGKKIWTKKVELERNTDYEFSAWFITAEKGGQQAKLQFTIDDQPVGSIITPPNTAPTDESVGTMQEDWERFSCVWNSGSLTSVDISIETAAGISAGASVCIDDIYFSPLFEVVDAFCVELGTVSQPTITDTPVSKGEIMLDAGIMENNVPYLSYYWYTSDGTYISGERTIIVNKSGTYFVEVSNGFCKATASFVAYFPPPAELEINTNPIIEICEGEADFLLDYSVVNGAPNAYSIFFGKKAKDAGFENKTREILPAGELFLPVPSSARPDVYEAEIQFVDTIEDIETSKQSIKINIKYDPEKVMAQKWNDVLALYNADNNGGYLFTACQWYKNEEALPGETWFYLYLENAEFDPNDRYSAFLTRNDGVELFTCEFIPERRVITKPFPTTLVSTLQTVSLNSSSISSGKASLVDMNGQLYSVQTFDENNKTIRMPDRRGAFILNIADEGKRERYIIIVQ